MTKLSKVSKKLTKDLFYSSFIWDYSAALAFYIIFAVFPSLLIAFSVASYFSFSPDYLTNPWWLDFLPPTVGSMVFGVAQDILIANGSIGLFSFGFLIAMWSSSTGMSAIMRYLNAMYDCSEERSFIRLRLVSLGIGAILLISLLSSVALIVVGKVILDMVFNFISLQAYTYYALNVVRIILAVFLFFVAFTLVYYLAPTKRLKIADVCPGGVLASVLFLLSSQLYGIYLKWTGGFTTTYGGLGSMIGLLFWLYILSFIILLGGRINNLFNQSSIDSSNLRN